MAPTIAVVAIIIIFILLFSITFLKIYRGPTFCQVLIIKHIFHFILFMISGNHKWNGGIPNFIIILIMMMVFRMFVFIMFMGRNFLIIIDMIIMAEASLCIRKYIILLSDMKGFFLSDISGINDIRLISKPTHIFIQFLDLMIIIVLAIVIVRNMAFLDVLIKKKKIILLYLGYEPNSLVSLSFYILMYVAYGILISNDLVKF